MCVFIMEKGRKVCVCFISSSSSFFFLHCDLIRIFTFRVTTSPTVVSLSWAGSIALTAKFCVFRLSRLVLRKNKIKSIQKLFHSFISLLFSLPACAGFERKSVHVVLRTGDWTGVGSGKSAEEK